MCDGSVRAPHCISVHAPSFLRTAPPPTFISQTAQGIPHKLIAIDKFLAQHPEMAGSIQLVQIAVPPRGDTARYQKLRNKIHKLVGRCGGSSASC